MSRCLACPPPTPRHLSYLYIVEYRGDVSWRGPVVRLRRHGAWISEAVVNCTKRVHAVTGRGHVRDGRAGHVLHLEVRSGTVKQHHYVAVVGRGCAESWGPSLGYDHSDGGVISGT